MAAAAGDANETPRNETCAKVVGPGDIQKKRESLHHTETEEKNVLPTKKDIAEEKEHQAFCEEISHFDKKGGLAHTKPPAEHDVKLDLARERCAEQAANFEKGKLQHVPEPAEHDLKLDLAREKCAEQAAKFEKDKLQHVPDEKIRETSPIDTYKAIVTGEKTD